MGSVSDEEAGEITHAGHRDAEILAQVRRFDGVFGGFRAVDHRIGFRAVVTDKPLVGDPSIIGRDGARCQHLPYLRGPANRAERGYARFFGAGVNGGHEIQASEVAVRGRAGDHEEVRRHAREGVAIFRGQLDGGLINLVFPKYTVIGLPSDRSGELVGFINDLFGRIAGGRNRDTGDAHQADGLGTHRPLVGAVDRLGIIAGAGRGYADVFVPVPGFEGVGAIGSPVDGSVRAVRKIALLPLKRVGINGGATERCCARVHGAGSEDLANLRDADDTVHRRQRRLGGAEEIRRYDARAGIVLYGGRAGHSKEVGGNAAEGIAGRRRKGDNRIIKRIALELLVFRQKRGPGYGAGILGRGNRRSIGAVRCGDRDAGDSRNVHGFWLHGFRGRAGLGIGESARSGGGDFEVLAHIRQGRHIGRFCCALDNGIRSILRFADGPLPGSCRIIGRQRAGGERHPRLGCAGDGGDGSDGSPGGVGE